MADGFETVENMHRCMSNNYSVQGFWRGWHRSYNRWIIRYNFFPLYFPVPLIFSLPSSLSYEIQSKKFWPLILLLFSDLFIVTDYWACGDYEFSRYIYIPLGGAKRSKFNVFIVFTFVAVWHDISLSLLAWGWLISLFILPEVFCLKVFGGKAVWKCFFFLWNSTRKDIKKAIY